MIKVMFCLRRRPGMSRAEFLHYWRHHHAPLALSVGGALGCKRYVQNHTLDFEVGRLANEARGGEPEFDGVSEGWFESLEAVSKNFASETAREAWAILMADEEKFIDFKRSTIFFVEELELL